MGLVNIQIGCQKSPLESGDYDENGENSENPSAMVKMANLAKIKMTFERGYFGENGKYGEQPAKSKQKFK